MPLVTVARPLLGEQVLVGRRKQIAELLTLLGAVPAVAVLRGGQSSGRGPFLQAFAAEAGTERWLVVHPPPLSPGDEPRALARDLGRRIGPSAPTVSARTTRDTTAPGGQSDLLAALRGRRAVLLIDGLGASPAADAWLVDVLAADLRQVGARVLLVLAGPPAGVEPALRVADRVVDVAPPTEEELRQHLVAAGTQLVPEAGAHEVETLAAGAAERPDLVGALLLALSYGQAP
jgi:hypothetical protein